MYQYRTTPTDNKYLDTMWKEWWFLNCINGDKMIWSKKIVKTRIITPKESIEEKLYYNETFVKWCCSYYKEIEEKYKDWRDQRKECGKFKPYTERSEKVEFGKISKFPKLVVEEMLSKAITWSWGRLVVLESYEVEKIMQPLRDTLHKEQKKLEGFDTDEEKKQAEVLKWRIEDYIKSHPQLKQEAVKYVTEKFPNLNAQAHEKMIKTRCAMMANNIINK